MSAQAEQIERLVVMAERLIEALSADIEALKDGRARDMKSTDPEIQRLAALYGREAKGFQIETAKAAPAELRKRFLATTERFREILQLHARLLTRIRSVSEGMIRAVVDEVEKNKAPTRTYGKVAVAPQASRAMLFNSVI